MNSGIEWGVLIAACSLIVGLAKFLDDYHVRNDIRSKTRDGLILLFMYLEQPHISNFPQIIYGYVAAAIKRLGKFAWLGTIPIVYFTMVSAFYFARIYVGDPPSSNFLEYALTWINSIFWALLIIWGVCAGVLGFISINAFLEKWNNTNSLISQWGYSALALILLFMISSGTSAGFSFFGSGYLNSDTAIPGIAYGSMNLLAEDRFFLYILTVSCLWHAIVLIIIMLLLTGFRSLYLIVHRGVLSILNAASNPKVSPFQYFAALIALSSLAFKMIDTLIS